MIKQITGSWSGNAAFAAGANSGSSIERMPSLVGAARDDLVEVHAVPGEIGIRPLGPSLRGLRGKRRPCYDPEHERSDQLAPN
jgi:hypothetical protein